MLEFQSAFPGAIRNRFHAAVIQISAPVEDDISQPQIGSLAGNRRADQLALLHLCTLLSDDILIAGRSRSEGLAGAVIDQLRIDIGIAPEHRQPGPSGRPRNLLADAELDLFSSECFRIHNDFIFRLFTSRLTRFLPHHLTHITNAFALVGFRFAQAADLRRYLADKLLINPFQ